MAEWLKLLIFSSLNRSSSHHCGFKPSTGYNNCETSQVLLADGQVVFLGALPFFAPPYD